ncbi:MAG: hypothetical protein ACREM6_02280, partial [Vulcanimicrobiaceae bacterium]
GYDAFGNATSFSKGFGSWTVRYDAVNRLVQATDPDGVSSYKSYFPDGSVAETQSAWQFRNHTGATFQYDADRDKTTEMEPGNSLPFQWWYDGADRIVQVNKQWLTRTLYDLSEGSTVAVNGASFRAYGNAYATLIGLLSGCRFYGGKWIEQAATAFDGLDRPTAKYRWPTNTQPRYGCSSAPSAATMTYDQIDGYGNALGDVTPSGAGHLISEKVSHEEAIPAGAAGRRSEVRAMDGAAQGGDHP